MMAKCYKTLTVLTRFEALKRRYKLECTTSITVISYIKPNLSVYWKLMACFYSNLHLCPWGRFSCQQTLGNTPCLLLKATSECLNAK